MLIVGLESPFEPSSEEAARYSDRFSRDELVQQNLFYARRALANSLALGEAPFMANLTYPQAIADRPGLRVAAVRAKIELQHRADVIALYTDLGVDAEMQLAADNAKLLGLDETRRSILDVDGRDPREWIAEQIGIEHRVADHVRENGTQ